jgi:single-strand DNA-binding protein
MAASFNQCTFIGRLGKDPDFSVTPSGTPVAKFSLAVDKQTKGEQKETLWLNIIAWDRLAEIVEKYTEKGRLVMVQGRLDINAYTDKEGIKRQAVQIIAGSIQLLDSKDRQTNGTKPASTADLDPFLDIDEMP